MPQPCLFRFRCRVFAASAAATPLRFSFSPCCFHISSFDFSRFDAAAAFADADAFIADNDATHFADAFQIF